VTPEGRALEESRRYFESAKRRNERTIWGTMAPVRLLTDLSVNRAFSQATPAHLLNALAVADRGVNTALNAVHEVDRSLTPEMRDRIAPRVCGEKPVKGRSAVTFFAARPSREPS
jgi:hypothetical protein